MAKKTGLVLTGGGLRGICAQTGALLALAERGYRFDAVVGTSAGAIVGALYASGRTAREVFDRVAAVRAEDYLDPIGRLALVAAAARGLRGLTGYYRGRALRGWLRGGVAVARVEECDPPFAIAVTNVSRGIPEIKDRGPLAELARASSAIPLVFALEEIDGELYADGGAVNNVAVDDLARLRPELEQFLVLTSLRVRRPVPDPDNRFLDRDWTPLRALGRVIDAVAEGQRLDDLDVPQKVVVFRIRTADLDLRDAGRIRACLDEAHAEAVRQIDGGEVDLADVPRV